MNLHFYNMKVAGGFSFALHRGSAKFVTSQQPVSKKTY